jgi:2-keto-4-pentenoate hydratase/2-oxohepta-3-ene-1,7-dioic acid hydratase in catechol pathway
MRLRRYLAGGSALIAVAHGANWIPLETLPGVPSVGADMLALLDRWPALAGAVTNALGGGASAPLPADAQPLPPFEPRSFRDFMLSERHAVDAARGMARRFLPAVYPAARLYERLSGRSFPAFRPKRIWYEQPIYYLGNHLNIAGDGAQIDWPSYTRYLDYELELGFVITRPLQNADADTALAAIGGFVVINDFSARDVQLAEMRSGFGPQKSKHFATSMSDVVATADSVLPWVDRLHAEVRINGRSVCSTGTHGMQHSIAAVLAHASRDEPLHPGELFGLGTLPGGCALENGHWLKRGDRIELSIERIGSLGNTIRP